MLLQTQAGGMGEQFPQVCNDDRPIQYGMPLWRDLFSPRQLLCHGTSVETFRELVEEESAKVDGMSEMKRAVLAYVALALNKLINRNARDSTWIFQREVVSQFFQRHDYSVKWSYAEMAPLIVGLGHDGEFGQVAKCIGELLDLITPLNGNSAAADPLFSVTRATAAEVVGAPVVITCGSGDSLTHLEAGSANAVVMDPPYSDNVCKLRAAEQLLNQGQTVADVCRTSEGIALLSTAFDAFRRPT